MTARAPSCTILPVSAKSACYGEETGVNAGGSGPGVTPTDQGDVTGGLVPNEHRDRSATALTFLKGRLTEMRSSATNRFRQGPNSFRALWNASSDAMALTDA